MTQIVEAIFNMVGSDNRDQMPQEDNTPEKRVDRIFELMDKVSWLNLSVEYFMLRTETDVYQKTSFYAGQNKTSQSYKHCHSTMVSFSLLWVSLTTF